MQLEFHTANNGCPAGSFPRPWRQAPGDASPGRGSLWVKLFLSNKAIKIIDFVEQYLNKSVPEGYF
jgi:hypothetical protein